jgi:hypothetical protein
MRKVWQILAGPASRSYADVFLRHGVGLIGPGDGGPWHGGRRDEEYDGTTVRRFATEVEQGDVFLLRSGTSGVRAVGVVASDYLYLNRFDDVNGWDLQHARRVRWFRLPQDYDFRAAVFGAGPGRFGRVSHPEVVEFAERFVQSPPTAWQEEPLPPLPPEEPDLEEVPAYLADLVALAHDYAGQPFGERVSEDEMIAHFVVPFFRSLGWRQEQIAVQWRYVDVALFPRMPRRPEHCRLIVEAKYPGAGVEGALEQGRGYAVTLGIHPDILVTDGFRYRLYAGDRDHAPAAYANLLRLKRAALMLFSRLQRP